MKRVPIIRKLNTMKTVTILRSLINDKIDEHFELYGVEEWLIDKRTDFEFSFIFNSGKKYEIIVPYDIDTPGIYRKEWISAHDDDGNSYCTEEGTLIISNKNYNPNQKTIDSQIDAIREHEEKKERENKTYN